MIVEDKIGLIIDFNWRDIVDLQPPNLKMDVDYRYIKDSFKENGFAVPFAVWKKGKSYYCVDGHSRKRALLELAEEGVDVPDTLKAYTIDVGSREEAIEVLLYVYNQTLNKIDGDALDTWLEAEDLETSVINFDGINIVPSSKETDLTYDPTKGEDFDPRDEGDLSNPSSEYKRIILRYYAEDLERVQAKIKRVAKIMKADPTDVAGVIYKMINND